MIARLSVLLPGVLARGAAQFKPLTSVTAHIAYVPTYFGNTFHVDAEVAMAVAQVEAAARGATSVELIGASLGGNVAPFVVEQLSDEARDKLKIVIVDAPAGAKTLFDPMAKFARFGSGFSFVTRHMKVPVSDDMLPKLDEISLGLDPDKVREQARLDLADHKLSMLISQTAWMTKIVRNGSLAEACKSFTGLDVTYLACVHPGNGVVRQPIAQEWWQSHVVDLRVKEVHATHCGFLQNQLEFVEAFRGILES